MFDSHGTHLVTSERTQCLMFCRFCLLLLKFDPINVNKYFDDMRWFFKEPLFWMAP